MYKCLEISEILEVIIDHVFMSSEGMEGMRAVVALALTCRDFLDPALNRLWHTQESLDPLIRTLPPTAWAFYGKSVVTIVRPLLLDDWTRFRHYASRIKVFGCDPRHPEGSLHSYAALNYTLLEAFVAQHPGLPLLPSLRHLHWSSGKMDPKTLPYVPLIAAPTLNTVSLDFTHHLRRDDARAFTTALIRSIRLHCPDLTRFLVNELQSHTRPVIGTALRRWLAQKRQYVPSLAFRDIMNLAGMRFLREAQLFLDDTDVGAVHDATALTFSSLRVLELHACTLGVCLALLKTVRSCELEVLSIYVSERPVADLILSLLSELHTVCDPASLHNVTLLDTADDDYIPYRSWNADMPSRYGAFVVDAHTLAPLAAFTQLRTLVVEFSAIYDMQEASLTRMFSAWPQLEVFSLGAMHGWHAASPLTFSSLARMLTLCPQLRACGLALDCSCVELDVAACRAGALRPNHSVTTLCLADRKGADELLLAECVQYLFPNLQCFE